MAARSKGPITLFWWWDTGFILVNLELRIRFTEVFLGK